MTFEEFEKLEEMFFADIRKLRAEKGIEYTGGKKKDRLANFKEEGAEMEIPPVKVAHIFFNKHYQAICSYIKNGREFSDEGIYGRFKDAILYLMLMYGLIVDPTKNIVKDEPTIPSMYQCHIWMSSDQGPNCNICHTGIMRNHGYIFEEGKYRHALCAKTNFIQQGPGISSGDYAKTQRNAETELGKSASGVL